MRDARETSEMHNGEKGNEVSKNELQWNKTNFSSFLQVIWLWNYDRKSEIYSQK